MKINIMKIVFACYLCALFACTSSKQSVSETSTNNAAEAQGSCHIFVQGTLALCTEFFAELEIAEQTCIDNGTYQWHANPCPRENISGSCTESAYVTGVGTSVGQFYYNPPFNSSTAQAMCKENDGQFTPQG